MGEIWVPGKGKKVKLQTMLMYCGLNPAGHVQCTAHKVSHLHDVRG